MEVRILDHPTGLAPGDHVFWAFDDPRGFSDAAVAYLSEGRERGERLLYVGDKPESNLLDELSALPERDVLLAAGQLSVRRLTPFYAVRPDLGPRTQSEVLRAETVAAVDAGYPGLRIAADVTGLATDPCLIPRLAAYELAVDEMIAQNAVTGMCGYDERRVGESLGVLAALHGMQHHQLGQPTFAAELRGGTVFLSGEIDLAVTDDLAHVCRTVQESTVGPLNVDMRELAFIDVGGTRVLARFARDMLAAERAVHFRVSRNSTRRCLELFDLDLSGVP